jgi:hypothetical protein
MMLCHLTIRTAYVRVILLLALTGSRTRAAGALLDPSNWRLS